MRFFDRLNRLRRDESGNVLAIGAAAMPMLIAASALAVDTIQLSLWTRQLQRTADSSALAGAYALSQGGNVTDAVNRAVGYDVQVETRTVRAENAPAAGNFAGDTNAVRVFIDVVKPMSFMSFFGIETRTVRAQATARIDNLGRSCIISLYEGTNPGIDVGGNANLTLGCGMAANSRGPSAITAGGSSSVTATPLIAVGGIDDGQNFTGSPTLLPYSPEQADPFADVPNPTVPGSGCGSALAPANHETVAATPGWYDGLNVPTHGTLDLSPGTYYICGNASIHGTISGTGVTLVFTGAGGQAGDLSINAQANLNLSAPSSGPYSGIIMYRDRRSSNTEISINGGATSVLEGALYFPSSDLRYNGGAGMDVRCLQLIGQRLIFQGGANISNECPAGGPNAFSNRVVRLVE